MKHWLLMAVVALAACGPSAEDLPRYQTTPDFTLTDRTGAEFTSAAKLKGHVWVADFIFTTCTGPCPRMSARMRRLQNDLADLPDLRFVSFTVDPENDTPEVLAAYARRYQARQDVWYLLTGPMKVLDDLCRNVFLLGEVKGNLNHSTRFTLVDRDGVIRGYYLSGDNEAMQRLVADIRLLAAS